jgi:hypothetical protein
MRRSVIADGGGGISGAETSRIFLCFERQAARMYGVER